MEDFGNIVCSAFIVWFTLVVGLIVLPAMFGISLGITEVYMKVLVKTLEVGQVHGGLLGIIQRAIVKACPHVWFERSEMKDRNLVTKRLRNHVADKTKLPILIFPEGTCVNNTSVMMFKKGSFEIGGTIYPVAIKYDPRFGDAFWNSAKYNMEEESAVQFANRVKAAIARQGGLVDLSWDGGLKRAKVKDAYKEEQQKSYSKMIVGDDSS
ncbi:UNVERIFIED_CONTAM: hypothetical protein FKN15_007050 [Acipenser sinensis]